MTSFDLSPFDVDLILIALAPELDLRYERLYAYLQDDVSHRRPCVDMALNLLCASADEKLARRIHFAPDAPLVRHGLIRLLPDPSQIDPPLLAHYLKLDEQIVRWLLVQPGIDARLISFCGFVEPAVQLDDLPLEDNTRRALAALAEKARWSQQPLRLYLYGPRGSANRDTAAALAAHVGVPLLAADLARAPDLRTGTEAVLSPLLREAMLHDAILYVDGLDRLWADGVQPVIDMLVARPGITIMAGARPWPSNHSAGGLITVPLVLPDAEARVAYWRSNLGASGMAVGEEVVAALAGRFRLTADQIAHAAADAHGRATWRAAQGPDGVSTRAPACPTADDLFRAARSQSGHDLAALARKVEPVHTWDDLVLPDDALAQLHDICRRVTHRALVLDSWGFGRKLALGRGVSALFAGPSGTGKTMAAAIIAGALGLDLYKIDLAAVVSKYIGETEKNLDRIFGAAEDANAILFFDEADALFGKRSEVKDAHDRYANLEIAYLLQRMEEYDGMTILATNLRQNMDGAFLRRLAFIVQFPFPDEVSRRRIWEQIWPGRHLLALDVDLDLLASRFKLSGGNICNIALAAAFRAAERGGPITIDDLLHATMREHHKLGKVVSEAEFNGSYAELHSRRS